MPYPNQTYGFAFPTGLLKVVARGTVFAFPPVVINTFIEFKAVPQVHCCWYYIYLLKKKEETKKY